MKRITLFSLLTVGVMILSACGSPTPAAEPPSQPEPTTQPAESVVDPTETAVAEESPTVAPAAAEGPTKVQITLVDNTITSSLTSFKAGATYTFVISNNGHHEHNFNISPPVAMAGGYSEALAQALLAVDATQIPPGSSTSVDFTFPASATGAVLEFNCLIRRHYEDGMRLDITVTG